MASIIICTEFPILSWDIKSSGTTEEKVSFISCKLDSNLRAIL